jgi:hypothetical protein
MIQQSSNLIAGEDLTAGNYVFLLNPNAPFVFDDLRTAGTVYKTKRSIRARGVTAQCLGFVQTTVGTGYPVTIITAGVVSGFNNLVAGRFYQPSDTDGGIEDFGSNNPSPDTPIGVAVNSSQLLILPNPIFVKGKIFISGGWNGSSRINVTDGFSGSNETKTNWSTLVSGRSDPVCLSSQTSFFAGGGYISSTTNTVEIMPLSNLTSSSLGSNLSSSRQNLSGQSSLTRGYFIGGCTGNTLDSGQTTTVDGLTFSTGTVANASSAVLPAVRSQAATGISALGVYILGGSPSSSSYLGSILGMTFSGESWVTLSSTLSVNRRCMPGVCTRQIVYALGGYGGSNSSVVDAFVLSNETCSASTSLITSRATTGGSSTSVAGYACCGDTGAVTGTSEAFSFSSETTYSTSTLYRTWSRSGAAG